MKTKFILAACIILLTTAGFDCIYDPLIISVDADAISGCAPINAGNGTFNTSTTPINLQNLIPSDYRDKFLALRLYDIRVSVTHPHPNGNVTGSVFIRFDSQSEQKLLDFHGEYEKFSEGVSLVNSPGLIDYNKIALASLLAGITNTSLPSQVVLRAAGSGPAVTQSFNVCMEVFLQVDADVN